MDNTQDRPRIEASYCSAVYAALQWDDFDAFGFSVERYPRRELFYPFRMDSGSYALKRYEEVLERLQVNDYAQRLPGAPEDYLRDHGAGPANRLPERGTPGTPPADGADPQALAARIRAAVDRGLRAQRGAPGLPAGGEAPWAQVLGGSIRARIRARQGQDRQEAVALGQSIRSRLRGEPPPRETPRDGTRNAPKIDQQIPARPAGEQENAAKKWREQVDPEDFAERDAELVGVPIIEQEGRHSLAVILANAGLGKTTLLKRIALFYSAYGAGDPLDAELARAYRLPERPLVPILVTCRELQQLPEDFEGMLRGRIGQVLDQAPGAPFDSAQVEAWLPGLWERALLLIDGLDELPDELRGGFVEQLAAFLRAHPCRVLATSRVAGLYNAAAQLRRMGCHFRSLLPLSMAEARDYAQLWIRRTQEPGRQEALLAWLEELADPRYAYLQEMMRTPLELIIVLHRLAENEIFVNRYQLFSDLMRELFTRHTWGHAAKAHRFKDTMTLLGYVAYGMLARDRLYLTQPELMEILAQTRRESFNTAFPQQERSQLAFLESLISNVGVMEQSVGGGVHIYSFQIRIFQEYLAAYACCNLKIEGRDRPDPTAALSAHLNDTRWARIVSFALAALKDNSADAELNRLIQAIVDAAGETDFPATLLEAEMMLPRAQVQRLCQRYFGAGRSGIEQMRLLQLCMRTRSDGAFMHVLRQQYLADPSVYRQAYVYASLLWHAAGGKDLLGEALSRLGAEQPLQRAAGAWMTVLLCGIHTRGSYREFREGLSLPERADRALLERLRELALAEAEPVYIQALAELDLAGRIAPEDRRAAWDGRYVDILRAALSAQLHRLPEALGLLDQPARANPAQELTDMGIVLGMLPLQLLTAHPVAKNPSLAGVLGEALDGRVQDNRYDQIPLAVACAQFDPDPDALSKRIVQVCGGTLQDRARGAAAAGERYALQYARLMDQLRLCGGDLPADREPQDWNQSLELSAAEDPALARYLAGDVPGSVRMYWARVQSDPHDCVAKDNLAYILRRETLDPDTRALLGEVRVEALLEQGLEQGRPHARLNLALWTLAQGDAAAARQALAALEMRDWEELMPWWRDHLWREQGDPEGALVCLLAQARGCPVGLDEEVLRAAVAGHPGRALLGMG